MHTSDESTISAVTLYRSGATVTRTLTLAPPYPASVTLTGLPLALSRRTVRVRGDGDAVFSSVRVGVHARPREEAPPAPDAAALRETHEQLRRLREQLDQLDQEIAVLSAVEAPPRPSGQDGQPPPASPMAARVALERFTDEAISARLGARAALRREKAALEEVRDEQQDRLRRSTDADLLRPDEVSIAATAALHVTGSPASIQVSVSYFVPGAVWAPVYQLRVDRRRGTAALQMRAAVAQRTGEDWSDAAMRFSTADPTDDLRLPTLSAVRIGKAQPPPPSRGYRPPPKGAASLFADLDRARRAAAARLTHPAPLQRIRSDAVAFSLPLLTELIVVDEDDSGDDTMLLDAVDEIEEEDEGEAFAVGGAPSMAHFASSEAPMPPPAAPAARSARVAAQRSKKGARKMSAARERPRIKAPPPKPHFSALRLPDASDSRRHWLVPITDADRIQEALEAAGARATFDIPQRIRAATREAVQATKSARAVARGRFDYAYPAQQTLDVPGDGGVHTVPVLEWSAPCEMSYVVVPREEAMVYRRVELVNPADAPLLPGPVEVYLDGQYAVSAELPLVGQRGRLSMGLGAEQAIRCARNCRFEERRSGEKVVAMTELRHDISVELVNTLGAPVRCEVRERIPQPGPGAEVVVEEEDVSPAWEPYDQRERGERIVGGRRWQVTLPPGQPTTLRARYIVKIYANNELVGGNRREA